MNDRSRLFELTESHGRAKLSAGDVIAIRCELAVGARGVDLAKAYGVTSSSISDIKRGRSWAR